MPDGSETTDMATVCRQLILGGRAAEAVEFLRGQPGLPFERRLRLLLGDAQRAGGDLDAALATYRQLDQPGDRLKDAAVAFGIGQVHYLQGEPCRALEVYEAADPHQVLSTRRGCSSGRALLTGCWATPTRRWPSPERPVPVPLSPAIRRCEQPPTSPWPWR